MTPTLNTPLIWRILLQDDRIKGMFAGQRKAVGPIVMAAIDAVFGPVADEIVTRKTLFGKRAELLQALVDTGYIDVAVDSLPRLVKLLVNPQQAKAMGRQKVEGDIAAMRYLAAMPMDAQTEAVALALVKLGMLPSVARMFNDGELTFRNLLAMQPGIAMFTERKADVIESRTVIGPSAE